RPTPFTIPTRSLSPWFPSGNNANSSNNGRKAIALQMILDGVTTLNQKSISGKIFEGKENIDNNEDKFNVPILSNNYNTLLFKH
ncbi:MAG: hypothetical protein ACJ72V_16735, partial [Nitrososphaeraceae archaeon]